MHDRKFLGRGVLGALFLLAVTAPPAQAQGGDADCRAYVDDVARLACYDRKFGAPAVVPRADTPETGSAHAKSAPAAATANTAHDDSRMAQVVDRFWDLTQSSDDDRFVVRTYAPNFVLPALYTSAINRAPSSPTRGVAPFQGSYKDTESEFQISLRSKLFQDSTALHSSLWFGYTQQSFWQVWDSAGSSPFRDTDYQPELTYVVPLSPAIVGQDSNLRWQYLQLGLAHQSNGQGDPLSRSWNRAYIGTSLADGDFGLSLRYNHRFSESGTSDDNPDLISYIGSTEITGSWIGERATASLTWRESPQSLGRGSLRFVWTYPIDPKASNSLRWYLQVFSGYGETLLDYNHRQTSVGAGVTLFEF